MKKMNLTEATVRALQKEAEATDSKLSWNINLYGNALEYIDTLYDNVYGDEFSVLSDRYIDAEEEFINKLLDERIRIEKLLGEAETDIINRNKRKNKRIK